MKKSKLATALLCAVIATISVAGCGSDTGKSSPQPKTTQSDVAMPEYQAITTDKKSNKVAYLAVIKDAPVSEAQLAMRCLRQLNPLLALRMYSLIFLIQM